MNDRRVDFLISLAFYGLMISGFFGIVAALFALATINPMAAGVAVAGSGLSFGLMAIALLRR